MRFILLLLFSFGSLQAMSKAPRPAPVVSESIGVRTLKYRDERRERPVVVELWYPTQQTASFDQPSDPIWVHPKEMRDVQITEGSHPLILLSHGHNGDRRDRSWLVEHLIRQGYVVASVEHHGNSWRSFHPLLSLRFWDRARDVTFTINELFKEPTLKNRIDPKRIGFVGYSLGGMTGLALVGAKAQNVKEIVLAQQQNYDQIIPEIVEKIDFSEAHADFTDRRIKAMVLLSPAAFIFTPQSLAAVKIPMAIVASKGDEILPFTDHADKVIKHLVAPKVKLLRDHVSHYVFLNQVSEQGREFLSQEIQTEIIQTDRLTVHKEVGEFVVDFFKEKL